MILVDNTILSSGAKCPRKMLLEHALHKRMKVDKADALNAGSYIHEKHAEWVNPEHKVTMVYEPTPDAESNYSVENIELVFETWKERQKQINPPFDWIPEQVEIYREVELAPGIQFCVLQDADVKTPGGYGGCELKTTKRLDQYWLPQWTSASQLTGQIFAGRKHYEHYSGVWISGIELPKPPAKPNDKCRVHSEGKVGDPGEVRVEYKDCRTAPEHMRSGYYGPYTRSEATIRHWQRTAINVARELDKQKNLVVQGISTGAILEVTDNRGQFDARGACGWCEFKQWCDMGAPPDMVDEQFIDYTWDPKERALSRHGG